MNTESRAERGAILIHVAIAILVLIGIVAFVSDYGTMLVSRGQAQNSADAGALAGAISMAYDPNGWDDRSTTGPARSSAQLTAASNDVWGAAPAVDINTDVYFTPDPADMCPPGVDGQTPCIRVDVYRDQLHGNSLPVVFGQAVGLTTQGVRATATARVGVGDSSDCMKPWAIPDKWEDLFDITEPTNPVGEWTEDDTFDSELPNNCKNCPPFVPDNYERPTPGNAGTGFSVSADKGLRVRLKQGGPQTSISPGVFQPVRLPSLTCSDPSGANCYEETIYKCNGVPIGIDDFLVSENGNMIGPTAHGVMGGGPVPPGQGLVEQDPGASWDEATDTVIDNCSIPTPTCASNPRVVAIPVYDTALYDATKRQGLPQFKVVNILGFFIEEMNGNDVVGYLTEAPGLKGDNDDPFDPDSSFLKVIQLIR